MKKTIIIGLITIILSIIGFIGITYWSFKDLEIMEVGMLKVDSFIPLEVGLPVKVRNPNWYNITIENLKVVVFQKDHPVVEFHHKDLVELKSKEITRFRLKSDVGIKELANAFFQEMNEEIKTVEVEMLS